MFISSLSVLFIASFFFCCLSLFLHLKKAVAVDVCLSSYTWRRLLLLNALVYYCIPCVLSHWWVRFPTSVLMLKLNPEIWVPDLRLDTKPRYLLWLKSLDKPKTPQHSPPKKNKLWKTGSNTTAAEQKSEKTKNKTASDNSVILPSPGMQLNRSSVPHSFVCSCTAVP